MEWLNFLSRQFPWFLYYKTSQELYFIHLIQERHLLYMTVILHFIQILLLSVSRVIYWRLLPLNTVFRCPVWLFIQYTFVYWIPALYLCTVEAIYRFKSHEVQRLVGKANMQTNFYKIGLVQGWLWIRKLLEDKEEQTFALTVQWGVKYPNCR